MSGLLKGMTGIVKRARAQTAILLLTMDNPEYLTKNTNLYSDNLDFYLKSLFTA
jgi:hypothetical protein